MDPKFAKRVDSIFLQVIDEVEKLRRKEEVEPATLHQAILNGIASAEARLGQSVDWRLAKYALACWIDEILIELDWPGREFWMENALEVTLFGTRDRYHLFYVQAREAGKQGGRDALEVFYIAVVLGFRGMYGDPAAAAIEAERLSMPATLEAWAKQTALSIAAMPLPPIDASGQIGVGAPPLDEQAGLITATLVSVVLVAALLISLEAHFHWLFP